MRVRWVENRDPAEHTDRLVLRDGMLTMVRNSPDFTDLTDLEVEALENRYVFTTVPGFPPPEFNVPLRLQELGNVADTFNDGSSLAYNATTDQWVPFSVSTTFPDSSTIGRLIAPTSTGGGGNLPGPDADGETVISHSGAWVAVKGEILKWFDPRVGGVQDDTADQSNAWDAMMLLLANGGKAQLPTGVIRKSRQGSAIPNNVIFAGSGMERGSVSDATSPGSTITITHGTVIAAFGGYAGTLVDCGILHGVSGAQRIPPNGGRLMHLSIDGANQCNPASISGLRWVMDGVSFLRPGTPGGQVALFVNANGVIILGGCTIAGNGVGTGILHGDNDCHMYDSTLLHFQRGFDSQAGGLYLTSNHIFQGAIAASSVDFRLRGPGTVSLLSNVIENTIGPQILIVPDAGVVMGDINIIGNHFYWGNATSGQNPQPADTYPNIKLDMSSLGSTLFGLAVKRNIFDNATRATGIFQSLGSALDAGNNQRVMMFSLEGNEGRMHQHIIVPGSTILPDGLRGDNLAYTGSSQFASGGKILRDVNQGVATLVGDGVKTTFGPLAHSIDGTPVYHEVTPTDSVGRSAGIYHDVDATNFTIHTATPIPNGQSALVAWRGAMYGGAVTL